MLQRFLFLFALFLALASAQDWQPYLGGFNLTCLKDMMSNPAADDALNGLQNSFNPALSDSSLVSIQALELSRNLQCVTVYSDTCSSDVQVFPPRSTVSAPVAAIDNDIKQMSDDELFEALKFDVNGFCASLTQYQNVLGQYDSCIAYNLNALNNLPTSVYNQILEFLELGSGSSGSGSGSGNAWNFDLKETLDLQNGCGDFKAQLATNFRAQLSTTYWTGIVTAVLTNYDDIAFDEAVQNELNYNYYYDHQEQCNMPPELACTQTRAHFYSVCQLSAQQEYNFLLDQPIDGNADVGSDSYNTYASFAETTGIYPCEDVFSDPCFGPLMNIPDLSLTTNCRSASYYNEQAGNDPSSTSATSAPAPGETVIDTGNAGSGDDSGNKDDQNNPGLSIGGIVAIVFSFIIIVAIGAIGGVYFTYRKKGYNLLQNNHVQLE